MHGMSTRDADEIRCRSCFRVTPWVAYCTHCGEPLPERQAYRPFEPEPEDELVRGPREAGDATPPNPDASLADAADPDPVHSDAPIPEPIALRPVPEPLEPDDDFEPIDRFRAATLAERHLADEPRSRGIGPLAVVAIVALGVMALGMGVIVAGVVSALPQATATPTAQPTASATPTATQVPSPTPSSLPTPSPTPDPGASPIIFPDGFTATAQPCAEQPTSKLGCNSDGASITATSIWIWVGFTSGRPADTVVARLFDASGTWIRDNSIAFVDINCTDPCNGWLRYRFSGLLAGAYTVRIERNGQLATTTAFTVTS